MKILFYIQIVGLCELNLFSPVKMINNLTQHSSLVILSEKKYFVHNIMLLNFKSIESSNLRLNLNSLKPRT